MKIGNLSEYVAVYCLLAEIDEHLCQCTRHYYNKDGRLLWTLDQVVRAILDNDLVAQ